MKNLLTYTVLVLTSCLAYTQTYQGVVINSQSQPVAYANVFVQNSNDNSLINGVITNEEGKFKISVNSTKLFTLVISFIGFQDFKKEITEKGNADLGVITLLEIENELDEIIITAKKPTIKRKVDRLIFNVEKSIASSSGDVIDLLQKTPGVKVDSDNIKLIGRSSVRVLVNDRLSPLTGEDLSNYLHSLSSDDISKIEVITNPPAKYEAEGNSGLINIVLKKVKRDYVGGNIRSRFQQATFPSGFIGGGTTYQKGKWSLFANMNSGKGSVEVTEDNNIYYPVQTWDTDSRIRYFINSISGRAGIDYNIDNNTSLGIQYLGTSSRPDNEEKTATNIFNSVNSLDSLLLTKATSEGKVNFHSLNTHFKTEFDTIGKSLSIDLDYFIYCNNLDQVNKTDSFLPNGDSVENSAELFRNTSSQNIKSFTSNIDFELPTKFLNLEFGGKLSFIKNNSDVAIYNYQDGDFVVNPHQSNMFEYKENTQAVYLSVNKSLKKWGFKVGIRLEFSRIEGNSITLNRVNKNDYSKLFPTTYITYNPNENNSWSINYGKRINRPSYPHLNPFRWYSNPYSYTEGNPFLKPFFIDNLELSHLYKNNLNTSFYTTFTEAGIDQVTLTDSNTNIQATVRKNFLDGIAMGLTQSYTFDNINWLESYLQYDLNYLKIESSLPNTINEQDGFNFYFSMDNSIFFNSSKTLIGELNLWYSAPGIDGVDYLAESYNIDLGLKCLLLEKKLQISLVLKDIFKTQKDNIKTITNNIRQEYFNYYDMRQLRISAKYQFGNSKLKSKRKQFSNEEERKRAISN